MSRRLFLVAIVLAAAVVAASSLRAEQRGANPNLLRFCPGSGIPCVEITREAYDRGHDQFRSSCGFCHGPTAAGGNGGPNLIFSPVIRLDEKGADITRLIQTGRPEKGMPVVPLTPAQVADIVAYLKARIAEVDLTSGRRPSRDYDLKKLLTGNADRGKTYFNGAGQCATCHSADGDLKFVERESRRQPERSADDLRARRTSVCSDARRRVAVRVGAAGTGGETLNGRSAATRTTPEQRFIAA